jgi:hypothetical protein
MRNLTIKAIQNFLDEKSFKESNTQVRVESNQVVLSLFDNDIAFKTKDGIKITNAGYKTVTTKERLNGIPSVNVKQKNGIWYLNDKQWNGELTKI